MQPQFVNARTGQPCTGAPTSAKDALIQRLEDLADRLEDILESLEQDQDTDVESDGSQGDPDSTA